MDSFEINKIAGAVLGTALVVFGLNELAGIIYHADAPEKPGMMIDVANAAGGQGAAATETKVAKAAPAPSAMKGCKACHSWTNGGKNKAGPNLWNVFGNNIGTIEGYKYSSAFKAKTSETWSYEALDAFLTKPKDFIPGTKMGFPGLKDEAKRAEVIEYLRTLSDEPKS